jgi:tRNA-splicing ligase RtcB
MAWNPIDSELFEGGSRELLEGRGATRKGAIRAGNDDMGIIPGSMGTETYITRGLGNAESYRSSSHGAGRRLSRGAAKREFTVESLKELMGDRAWQADTAQAFLDEHPHAYKDIGAVMSAQADLTEPVHKLRQIVNYKGE